MEKSQQELKELVSEYIVKETTMKKDAYAEQNEIVSKISSNSTLYECILDISNDFLNSSNILFKKSAMKIISIVIERVTNLNLTECQIQSMLTYCIGKLKDITCVPFCVKIIYHIITIHYSKIREKTIDIDSEIIKHILTNYTGGVLNIPAYTQETRLFCIKTFTYLLESYHHKHSMFDNELNEYLKLVLDAIDGEKDPRNIMAMFALIKKINMSIDKRILLEYSRSFFEILDSYYPIDFSPPKNSPDKITSEDLSIALNECFATCEYYADYLMDVFRDKLSSKVNDSKNKTEIFKTMRAINQHYPIEVTCKYFSIMINLIIQQILNYDNEIIQLEGLITYTEIIKSYYTTSNNEIIINEIQSTIETIFNTTADLLFTTENTKNSYDAKDLIAVIVEYDNEMKIKAFDLSLKLITLFLMNSHKYNFYIHFLKNADSLLFFCLKSDEKLKMKNYISQNIENFKKVFVNLFKLLTSIKDEMIEELIVDILTSVMVKTEIFPTDEIKNFFTQIFDIWKVVGNNVIEDHIGICINELIVKYDYLDNSAVIINDLEEKFTSDQFDSTLLNNDMHKYLNLLKHYMSNPILSHKILEYFCEKLITLNKINTTNSNAGALIEKLVAILSSVYEKAEMWIYSETAKSSILKVIEQILTLNYNRSGLIFSLVQQIISKGNIVDEKYILILAQNYIENSSNMSADNLEYICQQLKVIKVILIRVYFKNSSVDSHYVTNLLIYPIWKFYDKLTQIALNMCNDDKIKKASSKASKLLGIILLIEPNCNDIIQIFQAKLLDLFAIANNDNIPQLTQVHTSLPLDMIFISSIINALLLTNLTRGLYYLKQILNQLSVSQSLIESKILKQQKYLYPTLTKEYFLQIQMILKDSIQKTEKGSLAEKAIIALFINFYLCCEKEIVDELLSMDMLFDLAFKGISYEIKFESSLELIRKSMKLGNWENIKRAGYDIPAVIEILLKVLLHSSDIHLKVEILKCLTAFKGLLLVKDEKFCKKVIQRLKHILNDKKRIVRKFCGIAINIWNLTD